MGPSATPDYRVVARSGAGSLLVMHSAVLFNPTSHFFGRLSSSPVARALLVCVVYGWAVQIVKVFILCLQIC